MRASDPSAEAADHTRRGAESRSGMTETNDGYELAGRILGALSSTVPVGLVVVDPAGLVQYQNQRWLDVTGMADEDLLGRPWFEAAHPDDVASLRAQWEAQFSRRGRLGPFRVTSVAGIGRSCLAEVTPVVDESGQLSACAVVVTDAESPEHVDALTSPHMLERLLDQSEDVVTILNPDGSWRWSNGGTLRLVGNVVGYDPKEGIFPFLHPDDVEAAKENLARQVAGEGVPGERFEYRVRAADGTWHHMEVLVDVLLDDPDVGGIVVHARDVSERRRMIDQLAESSNRLSSLVAGIHSGAVVEDPDRRVYLVNQAFCDMVGTDLSPSDLVGRTLKESGISATGLVATPSDNENFVQGLIDARLPMLGQRITSKKGQVIDCDYVPLFVGGTYRGHLWLFRDVTEMARADAARRVALAAEREENRRLAALDELKTEAMAIVSHELRTPLTSITGFAELLKETLDLDSEGDQLDFLDAIIRNARQLLRLSDDLLALNHLEAGTVSLNVEPVEMDRVVRDAAQAIEPVANAEEVTLGVEVAPGPPLAGDPERLGQLFDNLLANAVKFTPPGGQVELRGRPLGTDSGWQVEVVDTGIGIPPDEREQLFTRFFRASNARDSGVEGRGLGLSIVKAIVELHGGEIEVHSALGQGTTVTVRLAGADRVRPPETPREPEAVPSQA